MSSERCNTSSFNREVRNTGNNINISSHKIAKPIQLQTQLTKEDLIYKAHDRFESILWLLLCPCTLISFITAGLTLTNGETVSYDWLLPSLTIGFIIAVIFNAIILYKRIRSYGKDILCFEYVKQILWTLLLTPVLFGSGIILINYYCDNNPAPAYFVRILDKHESTRRRKGIIHAYRSFEIESWRSQNETMSIVVGSDAYCRYKVGDTICIVVRPGALGIEYYDKIK